MKTAFKILGIVVAIILTIILIGGGYLFYRIKMNQENGGTNVEWSESDGTVHRNLSYGNEKRNRFDLFIPNNPKKGAMMLFVHGGSWMGGEKEDIEYAARRFAKQGYITSTMNYSRIASDTLHHSQKHAYPNIESMVDDIYACTEAIKSKCAELGHELNQMAIGGYSAGAHLAMLYSTRHHDSSPLPIRFMISWVGPADMNMLFTSDKKQIMDLLANNTEEGKAKQAELCMMVSGISGKEVKAEELSYELIQQLMSNVSPSDLVSAATPPAVLAYGANDKLVSAEHGKTMDSRLKSFGIESQIYIYPNSGHELGYDKDYTQKVNETISNYCKKYFK